jgi:hypothetical protein
MNLIAKTALVLTDRLSVMDMTIVDIVTMKTSK